METKDNLRLWNAIKQPPASALKPIAAGRLKGKTDVNPMFRYSAMTEQFGPCGVGWKYTIDKLWREAGSHDQHFAFASVSVYYKTGDVWSEPIPGIGGSMLVAKEKEGLHSSDEGYKMAVTDALGTAMKMIGMAADVYAGKWDGSKYINAKEEEPEVAVTDKQASTIIDMITEKEADIDKFCDFFKIPSVKEMPAKRYEEAVKMLKNKKKATPVDKAAEDLKALIAAKNKEIAGREPGDEP